MFNYIKKYFSVYLISTVIYGCLSYIDKLPADQITFGIIMNLGITTIVIHILDNNDWHRGRYV